MNIYQVEKIDKGKIKPYKVNINSLVDLSIKKILLPTRSIFAPENIRNCCSLAKFFDAEVLVVNVIHTPVSLPTNVCSLELEQSADKITTIGATISKEMDVVLSTEIIKSSLVNKAIMGKMENVDVMVIGVKDIKEISDTATGLIYSSKVPAWIISRKDFELE